MEDAAMQAQLPPIAVRNIRIQQAVAHQNPDRVPFMPSNNSLYAYHYDMVTTREWMTDPLCMIPVMERYLKDYDPDLVWTPVNFPIPAMETLESVQCRWPGAFWDLPENTTYQYVDKSFIGEDDYDEFFKDPTLFIMRHVLPKKYGKLGALAMLNPYATTGHCVLNFMQFGLPPVQEALQTLLKAGGEVMEYMGKAIEMEMTVINAGYPMFGDAVLCCPFDDFADNVRGLMELCMDVVTDPEKAEQVLVSKGYMCRVDKVVGVEIPDDVGSLTNLLNTLLDCNINIDYLYVSYSRDSKTPLAVMKVNGYTEVESSLVSRGYNIVK